MQMILRLIIDYSIANSTSFPFGSTVRRLISPNPLTTIFSLLILFCSSTLVGPLATAFDSRSSLVINGTMPLNGRVLYFVVEYSPLKGQPSSPFTVNSKLIQGKNFLSAIINGTLPASEYKVRIQVVLPDGTKKTFPQQIFYSSPEMPELMSVWTTENSLILVYKQPSADKKEVSATDHKSMNFSYQLEYWPILPSTPNGTSFYVMRTNSTSLRLNSLSPGIVYRLRLFALFHEKRIALVPGKSTRPPTFLNQSDSGALRKANTATAMKRLGNGQQNFNNGEKSVLLSKDKNPHIARITALVTILPFPTTTQMPEISTKINLSHNSSQSKEITALDSEKRVLAKIANVTSNSINIIHNDTFLRTKQKIKDSIKAQKIEAIGEEVDEIPQENWSASNGSEALSIDPNEFDEGDKSEGIIVEGDDEDALTTKNQVSETSSTAEPNVQAERSSIRMSLATGNGGASALEELLLEWTVPERVVCDSFLVRYTVLEGEGEDEGGRHQTRTNASFTRIPYLYGAKLELNVSCLFDSTVSSQWFAHRIVDLGKPKQVRNFRVKRVFTDEFYVASIMLGFDVPFGHDSELYEIVVAWALGKRVVGGNKLIVRGENGLQPNFLNISHLEPAKAYTFTVRNVSRELPGLSSVATGLRQIMPPVITSTVYPGQISSNSINVNFGESDTDHPFDHYELVFSGSVRNVTKKLAKNDPKSFNFNKLIPGKTYHFRLYTVYKHIRSRPVTASITTYPLKVASFSPLIGPGYATLFWSVHNEANNYCRFRLSYSSTSDNGIQKALTVELNGTVSQYRFTALDPSTYYTFTIIVIMGEGEAEAESESEAVTVGFGSFIQKAKSQLPLLQRYGTRELSLTFANDRDLFPDLNGEVDNFAVIITEEIDDINDSFELRSWYDVHEEELWPAYRASPSNFNPFKRGQSSTSTAIFIIGEEECGRRKLNEPYCNGALRAHVDYFVKIRAYTVSTPQVAMESEWLSVDGRVDPKDKGEERPEKKLPCYMYLNGQSSCRNRASSTSMNTSYAIISLLGILSLIYDMLLSHSGQYLRSVIFILYFGFKVIVY